MTKLLGKISDFWDKNLPNKSKKYSIRMFVGLSLSFLSILALLFTVCYWWISVSTSILSLVFLILPVMAVVKQNIRHWDVQKYEFRRSIKNKLCVYVEFEPGVWKEFKFMFPNTTKSFAGMATKANINCELGGPDGVTDLQKKSIKRSELIDNLLSDKNLEDKNNI